MIPSVWTSYFIDLEPEAMAHQFARKGWLNLELSDEHGAALLQRGDPEATGAAFCTYAKDLGVSFPQGHLWLACDIAAPDQEAVVERLKRWLDLFVAIGVRAAVLHPGGGALIKQGVAPEVLLDTRVRALRALTEHAKGTDLTICLENVPDAPLAEDLLNIIQAVGAPNLGVCLDTGHLHMAQGDQAAFIAAAAPYLKALHIADNDGSGDQHLMPFGRGTVPWDAVVAALRRIQYAGLFNLEIPGETRCPLSVRLAKLDYLKSMLALMLDLSQP